MSFDLRRRTGALALGAAIAITPAAAQSRPPGAAVSGTVRGPTGRPIAGALLTVAWSDTGARTDSLGRFVLSGLPTGRVELWVRAQGHESRDTALIVRPGARVRWNVVMRRDHWLAQARARERAEAAAGRADSIALGHLQPATPDAALFRTFGQRLFTEALQRAPGDSNTVLSPASAALALSMVLVGAGGETASRMARALEPDADRPNPTARSAALLASTRGRKDVVLQIANAVWVDTMLALQTRFERTLASSYGAVARSVPLSSPRGVMAINRWADSTTRGRITGILSEPLPHSSLFIANAVYFKGKWLDPFDKGQTQQHDFTLPSGHRVRVWAMERTGEYGYRRAVGYQLLRLPYRGGRTSMYILLPDSGITVPALVASLAKQGWPGSLGGADFRTVHVVLPRFKAEQTISLEPILEAVGFGIAFGHGADLRGIARWKSDGGPADLYISKALQKVFVEVNEEGTEAAAVTGIGLTAKEVPPPPVEFVVDRPFLFLLRDEVSGADLFVGSVARPQ